MYTRRTGQGWNDRDAGGAPAPPDPSGPGRSTRPARRPRGRAASVALRHLPHADQRVRPAPQHQLLQVPDHGQVTSCAALKILPRSRRTFSSWDARPHDPGVPVGEGTSSGPFTKAAAISNAHVLPASTLPFGSGRSSKAHLPHVSALSRPGTRPGIRPVIRAPSGRRPGPAGPGFLLPFGHRHSLLWASCSRHGIPPPLRSAYHHTPGAVDLTGFPRSARMRYDRVGCPLYPGTAVPAGRRLVRDRRLPPLSGRSLAPRHNNPARDVSVTRHQQGFPDSRPVPVLPLTCDRHGWNDGPWAFP